MAADEKADNPPLLAYTDAFVRIVCLLLLIPSMAGALEAGYVGSDVCAGCHKSIALAQATTNMAHAWQGVETHQLAPNYSERHSEGPTPAIQYLVERDGQKLRFHVQMPGQPKLEFPVNTLIGGARHGIVFLFRVPDLQGLQLPRAPMVEGRYFHSTLTNKLELELGFPEDKPTTYETAFGRVLTPNLEKRCLACHGQPRTHGTRTESGVGCEDCHGPGQPHLAALSAHSGNAGILNPAKLPISERMKPCAQCHAGTTFIEDPMPDNVLISDQVTALKISECLRQSGGNMSCLNCHDPHRDAPHAVLVSRSEKTCLGCHSATVAKHAGLCPVNRVSGCVGCHMPDQKRGAFIMADHWIRVLRGGTAKAKEHNPAWRTTVTPQRLYLRIMVLEIREKALEMHGQLQTGASFFDLARANSIDRDSAVNGGYLGDMEAARLDPAWSAAALKLEPGQTSEVIEANGKFVILQREPRTFREDAEAKFDDAVNLRKQGKQQEANAALIEALKIYPHFLRALTSLGVSYAEKGNAQTAAGILQIATRLYPEDEGAHFNLGLAYGAMGNDQEIGEYKRTIEIDADYVPAYLNWGGALYTKGQYDEAIDVYKRGIEVNPLDASLHYSLSAALDRVGKKQEAEAEMALAAKIDPKYAAH